MFRAFQGLFAAGLIPTNYAITANIYQGKQLSASTAILTGSTIMSTSRDLMVGGAFLETGVAIHGIAYLPFRLTLILSILAVLIFPQTKRTNDDSRLKDLDYIGSGILISGL